jgi:hypothetical protein
MPRGPFVRVANRHLRVGVLKVESRRLKIHVQFGRSLRRNKKILRECVGYYLDHGNFDGPARCELLLQAMVMLEALELVEGN